MLRKIDLWIGRHMSAMKWFVVWGLVCGLSLLGVALAVRFQSVPWACVLFVAVVISAVLMVGNARRM